mmetsp:Transcript_34986/g.90856  ORF Transcript_34986/g.90856 Transcript_34986/m.90856 type:complete len:234 (-) Transcript_34986:613-1314(-)
MEGHIHLDVRVGKHVEHHAGAAKAIAGHADGGGVDVAQRPHGAHGSADAAHVHLGVAAPEVEQLPALGGVGGALAHREPVAVGAQSNVAHLSQHVSAGKLVPLQPIGVGQNDDSGQQHPLRHRLGGVREVALQHGAVILVHEGRLHGDSGRDLRAGILSARRAPGEGVIDEGRDGLVGAPPRGWIVAGGGGQVELRAGAAIADSLPVQPGGVQHLLRLCHKRAVLLNVAHEQQ